MGVENLGEQELRVALHCHQPCAVVVSPLTLMKKKNAKDIGATDCVLDHMENAPFGSVGGKDSRENLKAPDYIKKESISLYLKGYTEQAEKMYGPEWRTVEFHWVPTITISRKEG